MDAFGRRQRSEQVHQLAEEHFKHDLEKSDQDVLRKAAGKFQTYATVGSLLGLGLGIYGAARLRNMRVAYFKAFRAMEKPVEVRFADGRTEPVPDITAQLKPSKWSDAATYAFFSISGLFLGGSTGMLISEVSAARTITKNPETKQRIEKAFRNFRIDVLKKELQDLEGKSTFGSIFR